VECHFYDGVNQRFWHPTSHQAHDIPAPLVNLRLCTLLVGHPLAGADYCVAWLFVHRDRFMPQCQCQNLKYSGIMARLAGLRVPELVLAQLAQFNERLVIIG
jgi:hypothetical protein